MSGSDARLGDYFMGRRERGEPGLPILSVTLDRGLVRRDGLDRRTETELAPQKHLRVRPGDIAYNMMRMWQSASGLAHEEAIVSPAYVVLSPKTNVSTEYAAYLFKLPEMIHRFWAYSYGLTDDRLRLYWNDFKRIPWSFPRLSEQRKIAEILSTWDAAIEASEKLLANAERQKRALMQQLLTGKRRLKGFEGSWNRCSLKEVAEIIVSNVDKKSIAGQAAVRLCNYLDVYENEKITLSLPFMAATATAAQCDRFRLQVGDVLITKDSETPNDIAVSAFVAEAAEDLLCGYHLAIIRPSTKASGRFLKFYFDHPTTRSYFASRANGATRFGLTIAAIEYAPISLPSRAEQERIAEIIAVAEEEATLHRASMARLRAEKAALMQQLLTGKRRVTV